MYYTFTQLKDLPTSNAGTVFHSVCTIYRRVEGKLEPVGGVFDNQDWFRKEVEMEKTIDIRCPMCGSTNGLFVTDSYHKDTPDTDDLCFEVAFECVCGHIRPLVMQGPSRNMIRYTEVQQN